MNASKLTKAVCCMLYAMCSNNRLMSSRKGGGGGGKWGTSNSISEFRSTRKKHQKQQKYQKRYWHQQIKSGGNKRSRQATKQPSNLEASTEREEAERRREEAGRGCGM